MRANAVRPATWPAIGVALVVAGVLLASLALGAACAGEPGGDAAELASIRTTVTGDGFAALHSSQQKYMCESALAIAERNAGMPLGDDAFALAQELFLRAGGSPAWFAEDIPAAPAAASASFDDFRARLGFIEASPAPYRPEGVVKALHARLLDYAGTRLTELEWARDNRLQWVADLRRDGTTKGTWWALLATADGTAASMGAKQADAYVRQSAALRYLRSLAERSGEPADFLAGWDILIAASDLAAFEPPVLASRYENGVFIYTYTADALASGAANAQGLVSELAAAREHFPLVEE